jgi:cell cycle protein kinase DBF2
MDEIRHILVERDILAGSRGGGGWLVQLLYAFQDEESIYLAMVPKPTYVLTLGIRSRGRLPFLNQRIRHPP